MANNTEIVPFQVQTLPDDYVEPDVAVTRQVFINFMAGFAPTSRITMRYALSRAAEDLGWAAPGGRVELMPWHRLTATELSVLVIGWRDSLSVSTIRLYMHALRGLTRAFYIHGMMPAGQFMLLKEVKLPRGRNRSGRGRSVEEKYRKALLADCKQDERVQGLRDGALIALLFASGLRRAELAGVLTENINIDECEVKLLVKGGDTVTRYFQAWAVPYLSAWLQYRREQDIFNGPIFSKISKGGKIGDKALTGGGVYYLLEQRSKTAGLPFIMKPHDGRRTLGTSMLSEHGELMAQKALGHADLSTTRIYDKRSDNVLKNIFKLKDSED